VVAGGRALEHLQAAPGLLEGLLEVSQLAHLVLLIAEQRHRVGVHRVGLLRRRELGGEAAERGAAALE